MSTTLTVTGMTCEYCEQRVTDTLASVNDVEDATADREAKRTIVEGNADTDALVTTVEDASYDAGAQTRTSQAGPRERKTRATGRRDRRVSSTRRPEQF